MKDIARGYSRLENRAALFFQYACAFRLLSLLTSERDNAIRHLLLVP
jgi:hypothetical protein